MVREAIEDALPGSGMGVTRDRRTGEDCIPAAYPVDVSAAYHLAMEARNDVNQSMLKVNGAPQPDREVLQCPTSLAVVRQEHRP